MPVRIPRRARLLAALAVLPATFALGGLGSAAGASDAFSATLLHSFTGATGTHDEALTKPDDVTLMGGNVFAAFQNGVGSMGEPSLTGNTYSTIVELTPSGTAVGTWDVLGKIDGMTADTSLGTDGELIATVNEDGSSSLYTLDPNTSALTNYTYSPALSHGGGTDAISIYDGHILISASAPSPAPANVPALYEVTLSGTTAAATPLFSDEASALVANKGDEQGSPLPLALTDPDSDEVVPANSPRFGGELVLDSQGDQQQIFTPDPADGTGATLWALNLSQSVDNTAWAPDRDATLYITDASNDSIDAVQGPFRAGEPIVSVTPCDANSATASCGSNYLGVLDLSTGHLTPLADTAHMLVPQGIVFGP